MGLTDFGEAIWKGMVHTGNLFGMNPFTMPVSKEAMISKQGIHDREKKAGIARNMGSPYDVEKWEEMKKRERETGSYGEMYDNP